MPRRAQTRTPPKPASDILANAMNSALKPGGVDAGRSGAGTAAGGESGGMTRDLERRPRKANPYPACSSLVQARSGTRFTPNTLRGTVFLNFCTLYCECRFAGYGNKLPPQ